MIKLEAQPNPSSREGEAVRVSIGRGSGNVDGDAL